MVQVRTEQEQLHRSELKTLNAQINPHFLYNTLDSVVWLAQSGDEKRVVQMVLALSKYFRLSLSGAKDFITVGEELQQVENYLIIQKMRFGDSFTYQITCENGVRSAKTPKIVLQPIVENAIVHGVGTLSEGGKILIEAHRSGRELEFSVRDNGCGIKPDVLAHILERNPSSRSGIGLKNVHQRIRLACGQEYGLKVESELDEGTTVRVRLPLHYDAPRKGGAG
jgi:two-component system sensor histidine kinase YesM